MKYCTAKEAAKKLKVSVSHIYELVKRGEIKKKEGIGKTIRIPVSELTNIKVNSPMDMWGKFDKSKIELISTHYGYVRKVINNGMYLTKDIAKVLNKCSSSVISNIVSSNEITCMEFCKAKEYGLLSTHTGISLITFQGIKEYLGKAVLPYDFNKELFIQQLEGKEHISIDEVIEEKEIENTNFMLFKNKDFGNVRVVNINGEGWLVGKDVATALGYQNASKALNDHVDEEDKLNNKTLSSLGQRGGILINESGLYSLVLSSKLPNAKKFKRWVTSEVLPSINKTGGYVNDTEKFTENYFSNLSEDTRLAIKNELNNKNRQLLMTREEIDRRLEANSKIINLIDEA